MPTTREATTLPSTLNVQRLGKGGDDGAALIVTTAEFDFVCDAVQLRMCFTWTMSSCMLVIPCKQVLQSLSVK